MISQFYKKWSVSRLIALGVVVAVACIRVVVAHTVDFEVNVHELSSQSHDFHEQEQARQESERSGESQVYVDQSPGGSVHVYIDGGELS